MFRNDLEEGLYKEKFTTVGAKPYDYVLMFKILVLQRMYHLSDEQTEYQIRDRLSFRDFLGLASGDRVPDARTIWVFRKELTEKGLFDVLFDKFSQHLVDNNLIMNEGIIIDGSFVEVPRQRNSREENKLIKEGKGDELWNEEEGDTEDDKKHKANKKRHKDTDARWTKKGGEKFYGYKAHAKIDAKSKLIKKCVATAASEHDSKPTKQLVDESDRGQTLHADSAYISIMATDESWIDELYYKAQGRWQSFGRYPDGADCSVMFDRITIESSNRALTPMLTQICNNSQEPPVSVTPQLVTRGTNVVNVSYYNMNGQKIAGPADARIVIQKITYDNGYTEVRKVMQTR